jgi:hypothetical protein
MVYDTVRLPSTLAEPRITADRYHIAKTERQLKDCQTRPTSVAFKLQKTQHAA